MSKIKHDRREDYISPMTYICRLQTENELLNTSFLGNHIVIPNNNVHPGVEEEEEADDDWDSLWS